MSRRLLLKVNFLKKFLGARRLSSMIRNVLLSLILCGVGYSDNGSIVDAARSQIGVTTSYDPSYVSLEYPNGDVPIRNGVCTDVVIRALRKAQEIDLQKEVYLDMKANFSKYPKIWGLARTDRNIDHRRVPNLMTYFKWKGYSIRVSENKNDFKAGDLVTCIFPPNLPHIMIVSDKKARDGTPLVIHNIGRGTQEESRLFSFKITGHYRIK